MSSSTPPCVGSAALGDLGVVGERDAVAGGELEPLRVVALHEALAGGVAQDPALAAHGLGDERPRGLLREDHPRRVELDELHVAQPAARLRGQAHRVAGVLVAPRGRAAPDARVAAGGEDDRVGDDQPAAAVVDVEAVGAEHAAVVHEQAGDVDVVADRDAELGGAPDERHAGSRGRCSRLRSRCAASGGRRSSAASAARPSSRANRAPQRTRSSIAAGASRQRSSTLRGSAEPVALARACRRRAAPSCPRDPSSRARR